MTDRKFLLSILVTAVTAFCFLAGCGDDAPVTARLTIKAKNDGAESLILDGLTTEVGGTQGIATVTREGDNWFETAVRRDTFPVGTMRVNYTWHPKDSRDFQTALLTITEGAPGHLSMTSDHPEYATATFTTARAQFLSSMGLNATLTATYIAGAWLNPGDSTEIFGATPSESVYRKIERWDTLGGRYTLGVLKVKADSVFPLPYGMNSSTVTSKVRIDEPSKDHLGFTIVGNIYDQTLTYYDSMPHEAGARRE